MEGEAQEAAFGGAVDGEVEDGRVELAVDEAFYLARVFFEHEEVRGRQEGHSYRGIEVGGENANYDKLQGKTREKILEVLSEARKLSPN
jgi:hypothetical protein